MNHTLNKEMHFERRGRAGFVTIDRAYALNAITHDMVRDLHAQLENWRTDPTIERIVLKAAEGRAFSAGGDIRKLYDQGLKKDPEQIQFFRDEYPLNVYIKRYPKPYISMIDGIAMGGGVGISFNGSHRIGTERMSFAMPEVGIGFFPDVGATWFLPRLPGEIGIYLGLTGARVKQADALATGLLTHAVESRSLDNLENALAEGSVLDETLQDFSVEIGRSELIQMQGVIDDIFGRSSPIAIIAALEELSSTSSKYADWAASTSHTLRSKSPTSVAVAHYQLRKGGKLSFEECMKLEFRIVSRILAGHEFYEGVRATIVDKDNQPRWQPGRLEDIEAETILSYFDPALGGDLAIFE